MEKKLLKPNLQKIITIVVILALTGLMVFKLYMNKTEINRKAAEIPAEADFIPVRVSAVELKTMSNDISFTGYFAARKEILLTAEAQGSIIQLNIKEGQQVRQGQIIARIDATAIQSNLATAHASLNKAIKDKERYERLTAAGAISQKQYEDIALNADNARAGLAGIQQQMKYTIIRSPLSGIISEVKVERGSFVTAGVKIGTVVDVSKLKMVIQLPEADVIKIKKGQAVQIRTEVYPDHVFNGNISLIGVQPDEGRKYNVEVEMLNNGDYLLKAGMFGSVLLQAQVKDNGEKLFIPRKAITGSIKDATVFVLNKDSTVSIRKIDVLNVSGDEVIVLKGIHAGEKVVISGQINLQEGKKVRVIL